MFESQALYNKLDSNYKSIKHILFSISWSKVDIETLKNKFSSDINSRRKLSSIRNIRELISVLEERCVLDCVKIKYLYEFENFAKNDKLSFLISAQLDWVREYERLPDRVTMTKSNSKNLNGLKVEIPASVVNIIGNSIGGHWKDFARALNLREYDIDNIEDIHPNTFMMVKNVFQLFEERANLMTYKDIILRGLKAIRRGDLHEEVDQIFSESSNLVSPSNLERSS